ncbi:MAG: hypothetical protein WC353_05020 [Candidatus Peribacter sp.]|jgi:hypothetical protein
MKQVHALESWLRRDKAYEEQFADGPRGFFRHALAKLLGSNPAPNLNGYRDHLLAGHAINALPAQDAFASPASLERLATQDWDQCARSHGPSGLQTTSCRRAVLKILMDLDAGKIPIIGRG